MDGGHVGNRTRVHGFADRCVTTPPRGPIGRTHIRPAVDRQPSSAGPATLWLANLEEALTSGSEPTSELNLRGDLLVSGQDFVGLGDQIGWQGQTNGRRRPVIQMQ